MKVYTEYGYYTEEFAEKIALFRDDAERIFNDFATTPSECVEMAFAMIGEIEGAEIMRRSLLGMEMRAKENGKEMVK